MRSDFAAEEARLGVREGDVQPAALDQLGVDTAQLFELIYFGGEHRVAVPGQPGQAVGPVMAVRDSRGCGGSLAAQPSSLQDQRPHAALREMEGDRAADRSAAYDYYVVLGGHSILSRLLRAYQEPHLLRTSPPYGRGNSRGTPSDSRQWGSAPLHSPSDRQEAIPRIRTRAHDEGFEGHRLEKFWPSALAV